VQQHRHEEAALHEIIPPAFEAPALGLLGLAQIQAHVHREEEVAGDRQQRAGDGGGEAVLHDVEHVLQRGEADRGKDVVDDGVEAVIERGIVPRELFDGEALAELLGARDDDEVLDDEVGQVCLMEKLAEDGQQQPLDTARHHAGDRAEQDELPQKARGFLFDRVEPIDAHQQNNGRQQRRQQQ